MGPIGKNGLPRKAAADCWRPTEAGWEEDYDYDDDCGCCAHVVLVSCVVPASMSKSDVRHMFRNLLS